MPRISPTRVLAATLTAAALSAPTASAMPASDPPGPNARPVAAPLSPEANETGRATDTRRSDVAAPDQQSGRDWRSIAGTSSLAATSTRADASPQPRPPTWPVDPQPITTGQPAPDDGGGSVPAPTTFLIIAGIGVAVLAGGRLARPRLRAARARH